MSFQRSCGHISEPASSGLPSPYDQQVGAVKIFERQIERHWLGVCNGHPPRVTIGPTWPADGSIDEQQDWIRGELRRIEERFAGQFENNEKVISGLRTELRGLIDHVFRTIADLQRQLNNKERETVQTDANGLRPIVSGIVLTGIQEELSLGDSGAGSFFAPVAASLSSRDLKAGFGESLSRIA